MNMRTLLGGILLLCASVVLGQDCQECKTYSATICISSDIMDNPFSEIKNKDVVVICPGVDWKITRNIELEKGNFYNFGNITDGGSGERLRLTNKKTKLYNHGKIELEKLEIDESLFVNESRATVTATSLLFNGRVTNNGILNAMDDCNGTATRNCGLYVDEDSKRLDGSGTVNVSDARFVGTVKGNQVYNIKGRLILDKNYSGADEFNIGKELDIRDAARVNSGMFYLDGEFNCNGKRFTGSICNYEGTEQRSIEECHRNSSNGSECMAILPVELQMFEKVEIDHVVTFHWISGVELSFDHYELQESMDGMHFETIEFQYGRGSQSSYESKEIIRHATKSYYRLMMVDLDGSIAHSQILSVDGYKGTVSVVLYPNPILAGEELNIRNEYGKTGLCHLVTIDGQRVHTTEISDTIHTMRLPVDLPAGTYIIEVIYPDKKLVDRIILK